MDEILNKKLGIRQKASQPITKKPISYPVNDSNPQVRQPIVLKSQ